MMDFVKTVINYITDELNCSYYYDLKIREFLFLMRAYYDKRQIFNFFRPIYNADFAFSSDIYKHLNDVRTVKEMAKKINYSLSGFEQKFKKVFDTSPYQCMQEQRAKKIYREITCTKRTFTEIAFEYDFSSPAHFNDFCKQYFQHTPGGLRKENKERLSV
jgi:AraC-like DNA-binding protein